MSSGYKIELNWEMVDEIIVNQLRDTWETLKSDLGSNRHIFVSGDKKADDVEIQKHIDALELLLEWYASPEQLAEIYD